jgi:hypothetical protein
MLTSHLWAKRCKHLTEMGWDEIRVRVHQAFAKRYDLAMYRMGIPTTKCDRRCWPEHSGRFFFRKEELPGILTWLRGQLPETADAIVEQAEQICQHRFDLLGHEGVHYGSEIDWHLDAVHGKRAPVRPWFRVPYLDFEQVGDSKIIWELNRHQHMVTLAKAYRLTEEVRYARELFAQWYHWWEQNPYPAGINWASSLEVAFRSLSWLWVWNILDGCSVLPQQFHSDLQRALIVNARHIERFLSTYFSPNTHLLGEGVGLFFIGTLCPGLPAAQRWQKLGWEIVSREAQRQVLPDGMHFEQSMYYHTYALDFFLHSRILAGLNGIPIPKTFDGTIQKMLQVLGELNTAGRLPQFGDDDGGRVFDPRRNRAEHLQDPLFTGAVLFNRPEFKAVDIHANEETLWLLGTKGARRFNELSPRKQTDTSIAFEPSGIYVMRSSNPIAYQLVIDAGHQGAGRAGHGHADALSVQLSGNGKPLLIDPGTFAYVDSCCERNRFRGTAAHNTVQVDNSDQAEPAGPFEWHGRANAHVNCWVTGTTFDLFVGSHGGYCRPPSPVQHRRYIFHLKSRFWLIRDILDGEGVRRLEASWHFAPGSLHAIPEGAMFVSDRLAPLALLFAEDMNCSRVISTDWYSPAYGRKEPSPTLRLSMLAPLPAEFTTMIIPDSEVTAQLGVLRRLESARQGVPVSAFRYCTANATNYMFFADESGNWRMGPWASDARFLFCSTGSNKVVQQYVICDGSYFELRGHRIFDANSRVKQSEWSRDTGNPSDFPSDKATAIYETAVPKAGWVTNGLAKQPDMGSRSI